MKKLRIFASSPSDTLPERAKVESVASMLKPLADNLGIMLDVADWSTVVPNMGRAEQVILNQLEPTDWDVFIGILWHRFGTSSASKDPHTQREYHGGTEEEFKTAYRLWKQYQKPRIMVYRCKRSIPLDALDPDQYKRVKDFFEQFDAVKGEHPGLYQAFDTTEAFEKLLLNNLQRLLLEYGEHLRGEPVAPEVVQAFAPKIPDNLPRRTSFFGRDREMDTALRAVSPEDRTWGVLLDGIGGIGKTTMAIETAYRCKDKGLFDTFIFVSAKQSVLSPGGIRELKPAASTLDEFLNETARVLGQAGITKLAGVEKRNALLDALRGTRALLIYDNLETLAKAEQEALADFLRELTQSCKAIITSRRRGGEGAVWLRIEKLEWDAARQIIAGEAAKDASLNNKLQGAGESRWQELYDETKGSPLALMHTLGLMRVRASLTFDDALALLRGNRDPDLQTFIFQEARLELTPNDETALRSLSFFVPSATFETWTEVAGLTRNALETTIDRLSALSLVNVLTGEERYALHPLTRNFVRDELLGNPQTERAVGTKFAEYWASYAKRYGGGKESYKTYHHLEAEWPNIYAAAEWLWQTSAVQGEIVGDEEAARTLDGLAAALRTFLWYGGRWDEHFEIGAHAYEAMLALHEWSKAGWHAYFLSWLYQQVGDLDKGAHRADLCTEAWAHGGNKFEQATGMRICGMVARRRKDYHAAKKLYQGALSIYRELKYDDWTAFVLNDLGGIEREREQYDTADLYYREALDIHERKAGSRHIPAVLGSLGKLALDRQQWAEARALYEKALPLAKEIGWQDSVAANLTGLARVHEAEGHPELALPCAQEALAIHERLQHRDLGETKELVERLMNK